MAVLLPTKTVLPLFSNHYTERPTDSARLSPSPRLPTSAGPLRRIYCPRVESACPRMAPACRGSSTSKPLWTSWTIAVGRLIARYVGHRSQRLKDSKSASVSFVAVLYLRTPDATNPSQHPPQISIRHLCPIDWSAAKVAPIDVRWLGAEADFRFRDYLEHIAPSAKRRLSCWR